jgi:hypothetical protein
MPLLIEYFSYRVFFLINLILRIYYYTLKLILKQRNGMIESNATVLATKAGGLLSGSSLFMNMAISQDPIYVFLGVLGSVVSLLGMAHEIVKNKVSGKFKIVGDLLKALVFGFILTPMIFMIYLRFGNELFLYLFESESVKEGKFNSFWLLASILTSWYVLPIWDFLIKVIPLIVRNWIKRRWR